MSKTVVITGASRGIGAKIAENFAKCGHNVVINCNKSVDEAYKVADVVKSLGGTPLVVEADISSPLGAKILIDKTIEVFGRVDVLVCNAGITSYNLIIDERDENIANVINTNLLGVINTCRYASINMIHNHSGKIINISSIWGKVGGSGESVYSATKAGVIGFSKALSKELGLSGINVNVVAPGVIKTDMVNHLDKSVLDDLAGQTSLGRLGTCEDVANVVEFLASDKADYITGEVISVDGGFYC